MVCVSVLDLVILLVSATHVIGNEFNFLYIPTSPNSIKLIAYDDDYRIEEIKYGSYMKKQHNNEDSSSFGLDFFIPNLEPCKQYQINAKVKNLATNQYFKHIKNILMIPPNMVLQTKSKSETILVEMNFEYRACFDSLHVEVDKSRKISYTSANLSKLLEINDLSPCTNYNVVIYLKHNSETHKIYNKTVTTKSKNVNVDLINYDPATTKLNWTNFLEGCKLKYVISIKLESDPLGLNETICITSMNEYKLDFLDRCSSYLITIAAEDRYDAIMEKSIKIEPNAPLPPKLISKTSKSITLKTDYLNRNDKCQIEMFQIYCHGGEKIKRFVYDEEDPATINHLKSDTNYSCSAKVKNEGGWSISSETRHFYVERSTRHAHIQMYVNSLSSNSIELSWISDFGGNWFLNITKAGSNDQIPKHCDPLMYNFSTHIVGDSSYTFGNLEPNTNYSIYLDGADARNDKYNSQIFVTTNADVPFQVTHLNISQLTGRSVTIMWQLPCKLNGRIKSFVGQVVEIDPHSLIKTVYVWTVPYSSALEAIEIFNHTENRIKPEHNYSISVVIKLVNFAGPLNESKIEFISAAAKWYDLIDLVIIIPIVCTSVVILIILIGLAYWHCSSGKLNTESVYMELSPFFNPRKRPNNALIRSKFKLICNMDLTNLMKTIPLSVPYDFNRIILKPNQYCLTDYINASYIDGYNKKSKYIATQDPTQDTVYNFWHMVIQEKCDRIVMLSGLAENSSLQYFQYYPKLNKTLQSNDIIIKNVDETKYGNCIKRSLFVLRGQKKKHVYHYQYSAWSNGDSPKYPLELFEFIDMSGTQAKKLRNPIIVHSSAGVGRTGTFIALDILFQELLLSDITSISQTVKELRLQRSGMVETLAQYEFLYEAIESYYLTRIYKIKGYL